MLQAARCTENPYYVSYHPGPRLNEKTNGHFTAGVPPANDRNRKYLITMDVDKVHVVVCVCVCVCALFTVGTYAVCMMNHL